MKAMNTFDSQSVGANESVSLPNQLLFAWVEEEIAAGHTVHFRVKGGSMRPWMPEGTEVILEPCQVENLRANDVVLFRHQGRHILHRIVRRRSGHLVLQGDAVTAFHEECELGDVVGMVRSAIHPSGWKLRLDSRPLRGAFRLWRMLGPLRGKALRVLEILHLVPRIS
jgi:hypothetical protein